MGKKRLNYCISNADKYYDKSSKHVYIFPYMIMYVYLTLFVCVSQLVGMVLMSIYDKE